MNHFPETTAALRRLSRAIADLFKSPSQLYAELCQSPEYQEYNRAYKEHIERMRLSRFLEEHGLADDPGIDRSSSPYWRVKDYEETETGEK